MELHTNTHNTQTASQSVPKPPTIKQTPPTTTLDEIKPIKLQSTKLITPATHAAEYKTHLEPSTGRPRKVENRPGPKLAKTSCTNATCRVETIPGRGHLIPAQLGREDDNNKRNTEPDIPTYRETTGKTAACAFTRGATACAFTRNIIPSTGVGPARARPSPIPNAPPILSGF
jgi:CCR4-NOT transcriptional regulation complex, NOT5 subunit